MKESNALNGIGGPRKIEKMSKMAQEVGSQECIEQLQIWTVHYELTPQGQMVNQHCYLEVLTRLWESGQKKRP
jgi:hypothetical protein